MWPLLPAWLMSLLPGLSGGFINALLQQGQINKMNAYNDPRAQMQRLMRAGLPAAAMGTAGAGQQSQIPDVSGIGNAISNYFQSDQQRVRAEIMLEELRNAGNNADISGYNRDVLKEERDAALMPFVSDQDKVPSTGLSFAKANKLTNYYSTQNALRIQANQGRLAELDLDFKKALQEGGKDSIAYKEAVAKLDSVLADLNLKNLNLKNETLRTEARRVILEKFSRGGMNLFEAVFVTLLNKFGF